MRIALRLPRSNGFVTGVAADYCYKSVERWLRYANIAALFGEVRGRAATTGDTRNMSVSHSVMRQKRQ